MPERATRTGHNRAPRQRASRPSSSTPPPCTRQHRASTPRGLTVEDVRKLPATIDLLTAGRALGIGRTKAYQLARTGDFPCRIWRVGRSYRVRTTDLQAFLGITPPTPSRPSASRRKDK